MSDIKYIYYEVYSSLGTNNVEPRAQNINVLMLKPHTNSDGFWGTSSRTRHKSVDYNVHIRQIWVDLEKYNFGHSAYYLYDKEIYKCLEYINIKLRKNKLEKISIIK